MLWDKEKFDELFQQIKKAAAEEGDACSVVLFVSPDCDAICSYKILTTLLESEFIQHKVVPVSNYEDIEKHTPYIQNTDELRSIIFINCGGTVDIANHLEITEKNCNVYIIDSHRPYHLANVFDADDAASSKVCILDDGARRDEIKYIDAIREELQDESDDSDNEDEDDDDSDDDEETVRAAARRRTGMASYESLSPDARRNRRRTAQRQVKRYYKGSWYGTASATQCYALATQLNKTNNSLLWLSILGLTDQFVHERVDRDKYQEDWVTLSGEVGRWNQVGGGTHSKQISDDTTGNTVVDVPLESAMRINLEEEYRFMLFRHWSLYDSIFHSPYVASRLGIWKEPGEEKLKQMLGKMGIPLVECQQKYTYMKASQKSNLREKLEKYSPEFGLSDIFYQSFKKVTNYSTEIAAADVVYAVTALLEADMNDASSSWEARFWLADGALNASSSDQLKYGLDLATQLQRSIVLTGTSLIEKKAISRTGAFSYAKLTDSVHKRFFAHSLTLSKLALFLTETQREAGRPKKPFVICNPNATEDKTLVVAVTGPSRFGDVRKNNFGIKFRNAATMAGAHVKHDGFETAVIEVQNEDLENFINNLLLL